MSETPHKLVTQRAEPGLYRVYDEGWSEDTPYQIRRNQHGTWDLMDGEQLLSFGRSRKKDALADARARWPHDQAWRKYQANLAEWRERKEQKKAKGAPLRLAMVPRPDTRELEPPGHLSIEAKMVACRIGDKDRGDYPGFEVWLGDTVVGRLILLSTSWHCEGSGHYYAGPNQDWVTLRHGTCKDPEQEAMAVIRTAMTATLRRYLSAEVERRDAEVEEMKARHA